MNPTLLHDEAARLKALRKHQILDTLPEQAFDDLTFLAAQVCDAPMALISFMDAERAWLKSKIGIEASEFPRYTSFCAYTIRQPDLFVVADALRDERFATNPLVTSDPHIRFYAGAPLITPEGYALGTLCVLDRVPHELNDWEKEALRALGRQVLTKLELRRSATVVERTNEELRNKIAEGKRAMMALRESEDRYRDLVENSQDLICTHDLEGRLLSVNPWAAKVIGYDPSSLLKKNIRDGLLPEFRHLFDEYLTRIQRDGCASGLMVVQTRTGEKRIWEYNNTLRTQGVAVPIVRGMAHDITERKRAEEALRASERFARSTFDALSAHIAILDETGTVIAVNRAWRDFAEANAVASNSVGVGDNYLTICEATQNGDSAVAVEFAAGIRAVMNGERQEFSQEYSCHSPSEQRWFIGRVTRFPGEGPTHVVVAHENITDLKQTEQRLRESEEKLRQLQKMEAIGRLAGGIAHDFNNLLTAIIGYSDLSLRRLEPADPVRRNVEEIKRAGERAATLTRQLLAFSRKQILKPKALNLNNVIREMDGMLQRLIGERIELTTELEPTVGHVKADPSQIEQVLMNLTVNACDAMPEGGRLVIKTANIDLDSRGGEEHTETEPGRYVLLAVSDTGHGMDADTQAHIFEPFFTTKEQGKGTGLGLSTVYGIVNQSDGHICVHSEPRRGATFEVYLPRVDTTVEETELSAVRVGAPQGRETVLLVEDESMVRSMTREVLEESGYRVIEATNGTEAITICRLHAGPIHLMLTDVIMPGVSVRELAGSLRQLRPDMRVLYMSGYTDDAIVHHGVLDEGVDFIEKPFTPDALTRKVSQVLETHPGEPSHPGSRGQ